MASVSPEEHYFSTEKAPENLYQLERQAVEFIDYHYKLGHRIALVTVSTTTTNNNNINSLHSHLSHINILFYHYYIILPLLYFLSCTDGLWRVEERQYLWKSRRYVFWTIFQLEPVEHVLPNTFFLQGTQWYFCIDSFLLNHTVGSTLIPPDYF